MMPAFSMNEENREDFYPDMKDKRILKLPAQDLPGLVEQCLEEAGVERESIDLVVPHQVGRALGVIILRLGFRKGTYTDRVLQHGNVISASIPYALCEAIKERQVGKRDPALLIGTVADLTANFLLIRI